MSPLAGLKTFCFPLFPTAPDRNHRDKFRRGLNDAVRQPTDFGVAPAVKLALMGTRPAPTRGEG